MSNVKEFQRTDAATGNERRPTVERRKGGTWSSCVDDDRSRRRPGRSATRTSWHSSMVYSKAMQLAPPWSQPVLVDATNAMLQER